MQIPVYLAGSMTSPDDYATLKDFVIANFTSQTAFNTYMSANPAVFANANIRELKECIRKHYNITASKSVRKRNNNYFESLKSLINKHNLEHLIPEKRERIKYPDNLPRRDRHAITSKQRRIHNRDTVKLMERTLEAHGIPFNKIIKSSRTFYSRLIPVPIKPRDFAPVTTTEPLTGNAYSPVTTEPRDFAPVTTEPRDFLPVTTEPWSVSTSSPVTTEPRDFLPVTTEPRDFLPVTTEPRDFLPVTTEPRDFFPVTTTNPLYHYSSLSPIIEHESSGFDLDRYVDDLIYSGNWIVM